MDCRPSERLSTASHDRSVRSAYVHTGVTKVMAGFALEPQASRDAIDQDARYRYRYSSKVAGARSPEGEYAQKTLEKLGLLWRLAGCQTPIATGAHPGGEAQASPATSTAF